MTEELKPRPEPTKSAYNLVSCDRCDVWIHYSDIYFERGMFLCDFCGLFLDFKDSPNEFIGKHGAGVTGFMLACTPGAVEEFREACAI